MNRDLPWTTLALHCITLLASGCRRSPPVSEYPLPDPPPPMRERETRRRANPFARLSMRRMPALASITPSAHLADVRYEIRGALTRRARELEAAGLDIIKLNIGNPGRYGFEAPAHLREAIASHLHESEAYGHEQGLEAAVHDHGLVDALGAEQPGDQADDGDPQIEPDDPEDEGHDGEGVTLPRRLQLGVLDDQRSLAHGRNPQSGLTQVARVPRRFLMALGTSTTVVKTLSSQYTTGYQIIQ